MHRGVILIAVLVTCAVVGVALAVTRPPWLARAWPFLAAGGAALVGWAMVRVLGRKAPRPTVPVLPPPSPVVEEAKRIQAAKEAERAAVRAELDEIHALPDEEERLKRLADVAQRKWGAKKWGAKK